MTRRDRSRGDPGDRSGPDPGRPPGPASPRNREEPRPGLRAQLASATVAARALLPVRFFFGVTFVYAGLDKLLDPSFFDPASPTSIAAQMAAFARVSPLAPLVRIGVPFAIPLGLLIAFAEIAIGLGALTGLAYRIAAAGGFALSLLFFLTASWATHAYYYGPDLPYAAGWLALTLAGHGNLLVPDRVLALGRPAPPAPMRFEPGRSARGDGWSPRPADGWASGESPTMTRRTLVQLGILGAAALVVGTAIVPLRLLRRSTSTAGDGVAAGGGVPSPGRSPGSSASPTPRPSATPAPSAAAGPGTPVASVADFQKADAVAFTVPFDAPPPLPAGDPAVVVKLAEGSFVAYDAVCTHEGCTVEWDAQDGILLCPCHGAAFDPAHRARVLAGPTRQPLAALPLSVDPATGTISLRA
jgi:thiosulfate dehydrogenase [quinone] large subunit